MTDPHPWPDGLDITDPNAAQAAALPPVVLPQLWRVLAEALSRWQNLLQERLSCNYVALKC